MDEVINLQEDLYDFNADENKNSESSFKTLSDPTVIVNIQHGGTGHEVKDHQSKTKQNLQNGLSTARSTSSRKDRIVTNEPNILPITHVTLNLSIVNKKTSSNLQWRHNFVRKKANKSPTSRSNSNLSELRQNSSVTRSNSVTKNQRELFHSNPSQQSDYLDTLSHTLTTPDLLRPRSITKSRESSALSYHINDYKNFEYNRQSLTLAQQQQRQNSIHFRQSPQNQNYTASQQMRFVDASTRQVSYIDIIRSKSSTGESSSSICSVELLGQKMQKHNYTVAEFNKFKSKLLKNHSRNYYIFDRANLSSNNSDCRIKTNHYQPPLNHSQPMFQLQPVSKQQVVSTSPIIKQHISQIKSIYETIQRANIKKQSTVDIRRLNYLNSLKNTHEVLSNSLSVTKLS